MRCRRRVHIVPVQDDAETAVEFALEGDADVAYVLGDAGTDSDAPGAVVEALEEADVDVYRHDCDHDDFPALLAVVTSLADRHEDDPVRVHTATGSRWATVAACSADMNPEVQAAAHPEPYSRTAADRSAVSVAGTDIGGYPSVRVDVPTRDMLAGLAIVFGYNRAKPYTTIDKQGLVDYAMAVHTTLTDGADGTRAVADGGVTGVPFAAEVLEGYDHNPGFDGLPGNEQRSAYGLARNNVHGDLVEEGYLTVETAGTKNYLKTTDAGRELLRVLRHEVEDVVEALAGEVDADRWPAWFREGYVGADDGPESSPSGH